MYIVTEHETSYIVEVNYVSFVVDGTKLTEFVQQMQNIVEKTYINGAYVYHVPITRPNIVIYPLLDKPLTVEELIVLKGQ